MAKQAGCQKLRLRKSRCSEKKNKSNPEPIKSIENTLARRYALQLATPHEKSGNHDEAKRFKDMKFEFTP